MFEKIDSNLNEYPYDRERIIAWAMQKFGLDHAWADDLVAEAERRWIECQREAGVTGGDSDFAPNVAWLYTVVRNLAIDHWRGDREVEMLKNPETGQTLEDQVAADRPGETPRGIENNVIASDIEKNLPEFWKFFYTKCNWREREIADFVAANGAFFEHDGTLAEITQSMYAVLWEEGCDAMGIDKPRSVLGERIRQEFGLTITHFDLRRYHMRNHWRDARSVFDSPKKRRSSPSQPPDHGILFNAYL